MYEIRIDLWIVYYDKVQAREANINKRWYIGDKDRYYSALNSLIQDLWDKW